jgi:hypothetical protein
LVAAVDVGLLIEVASSPRNLSIICPIWRSFEEEAERTCAVEFVVAFVAFWLE